jgi:hypothetical protein
MANAAGFTAARITPTDPCRLCTVCLIEGPLCGRADRPVLCRYKIIAPTERGGGGCGFLAVERGCGFDDYLPRCARLLAGRAAR